jgi:hypothetical protein
LRYLPGLHIAILLQYCALISLRLTSLPPLRVNICMPSMPGVKPAMAAARALVGHFSGSSQAAAALAEMATNMKYDRTALLQDIVTRWWSTYSMCKSLLDLKGPLIALRQSRGPGTFQSPAVCQLSDNDWSIVEQVCVLLEPFMEVQRELEAERNVTISLCIPYIWDLRTGLAAAVEDMDTTSPVGAAMHAVGIEMSKVCFVMANFERLALCACR